MTSSPPPPPYNPYAAPITSDSERPRVSLVHVPGEGIKWVYATLVGVALPLQFIDVRWQHLGLTRQSRASVELIGGGILLLAGIAIFAWTYSAWSTLPLRNRVKSSPLGAVVRTFLPWPYWHIVLQLRLCDGLDAALEEAGEPPNAPKVVGALAGCALFLPYLLMAFGIKVGVYAGIAGNAAWFFYMFDCDASRRVLVEATAAKRAREMKAIEATAAANARPFV